MGWLTKPRVQDAPQAGRTGAAPVRPAIRLTDDARRATFMAASVLLDYPDPVTWAGRVAAVERVLPGLPEQVSSEIAGFLAHCAGADPIALGQKYVRTFDLTRKCALYLSYFAMGDTRRRGAALVAFTAAYRSAGWLPAADELPDYLPMVLEFAARSEAPIAGELLAAHREGIEVLVAALESQDSPWAALVRAVRTALPPLDAAGRDRVLALIDEGPPAETVGLTFLGAIPPYAPAGRAAQEVRA